ADPSGYTVTIDWGDGTNSTGTVVADGLGVFDVLATKTYAQTGRYNGSVTLRQPLGQITTVQLTVDVYEPQFPATANVLALTEGTPFSGIVGVFSDPDLGSGPSSYSAQITWGDGSESAGSVSSSGTGHYQVAGSHVYAR